MKKSLSLFLAVVLVLLSFSAVFAEGSMNNFSQSRQYDGRFTDVKTSDWFYQYVTAAYEYGFVSGNSATTFNPNGNVTIAETLVIACQINSIYYQKEVDRSVTSPWYQPYVNYAIENGIIGSSDYSNYTVAATRLQFATIMAKALPEEEYPVLSTTAAIPDVPNNASYAAPIYKLYDAGIISGSDEKGTFHPNNNIKRSEVAVIALNVADKSRRKANHFEDDINPKDGNKNLELIGVAFSTPYNPTNDKYTDFEVDVYTGGYIVNIGDQFEASIHDKTNVVESVEWVCDSPYVELDTLRSFWPSFPCQVVGLQACKVNIIAKITFKDGSVAEYPNYFTFQSVNLNQEDIDIRVTKGYHRAVVNISVTNLSTLPLIMPTSFVIEGGTYSWPNDTTVDTAAKMGFTRTYQLFYKKENITKADMYDDREFDNVPLVITWGGEQYYVECGANGITYFKKGNKR